MKKCAPDCDDQLPTIAHVGRGPKGDKSVIRLSDPDTENETYVEGWDIDSDTNEEVINSHWITENINGGQLLYQYNLRPYTIPRTFTITFIYRRPGREEWSWTTPAIPYIWTLDDAGTPEEMPDHVVGSGVATLFIKTMSEEGWHEQLNYPEGTTRDDFNVPEPDEAWASTIRFGLGGDIEIPDYHELARILGVSYEQIISWIKSKPIILGEVEAMSLKDYIDQQDESILDHVHTDLGFCQSSHDDTGAFGGQDTVKAYIDAKVSQATAQIYDDLKDLIYGASINPATGKLVIQNNGKIPTGNINIFSGEKNPTTNEYPGYIRTRDGEVNNDLKGM